MKYRFMRILFLSTLVCFSLTVYSQHFNLVLEARGIPDGTIIGLKSAENANNDAVITTGKIKSNKVVLTGVLSSDVVPVLLYTPNMKQYKLFWLEPGTTQITMTTTTLRNATINGGTVNADMQQLQRRLTPIEKKQEQLEGQIEKEKNKTIAKSLIQAYEKTEEDLGQTTRNFIREHPNALLSVFLLNTYTTAWGPDTTRILYHALAPALKENSSGKQIAHYLSVARNIGIDSAFVEVAGLDTSGITRRLSDSKGKWVLLEFWASWCAPCREENPALVNFYKNLSQYPFQVFAVSLDEVAADWKNAINQDKLPWIHVSELKGFKDAAALTYGVSGIPENFLINPEGKIVAKGLRGKELQKWIPAIKGDTR